MNVPILDRIGASFSLFQTDSLGDADHFPQLRNSAYGILGKCETLSILPWFSP
jgi:hypothetical protein